MVYISVNRSSWGLHTPALTLSASTHSQLHRETEARDERGGEREGKRASEREREEKESEKREKREREMRENRKGEGGVCGVGTCRHLGTPVCS